MPRSDYCFGLGMKPAVRIDAETLRRRADRAISASGIVIARTRRQLYADSVRQLTIRGLTEIEQARAALAALDAAIVRSFKG